MTSIRLWIGSGILVCVLAACASTSEVKTQKYAQLRTGQMFEFDLQKTWKGIEKTAKDWPVTDRDPEDVKSDAWKDLNERSLKTDWIYGKSRDKYVEYKANGFPRKQYLNHRVRYEIKAKRVRGGTDVAVIVEEELEELDDNGQPKGYYGTSEIDSALANDVLKKINLGILGSY